MDKHVKPEKKAKLSPSKPIPSSAEQLAKASKESSIELSEADLVKVAGGCASGKHFT
jgi:hypothetical protein